MTARQVDAIVRLFTVMIALNETPGDPFADPGFNTASYTAGYHAGARRAYADAICRLRELDADVAAEQRIGAVS